MVFNYRSIFTPQTIVIGLLVLIFIGILFLDNGLPIARNNYLLLSLVFLGLGIVRLPQKRSIEEILFYLWGGILLVYLSYSSMTHFPTNEVLNRNFFRFNHYIFLSGFIYIFRRLHFSVILTMGVYLLLIHSFFFHLSSELGVLMIPYLTIGFWLCWGNRNLRAKLGSFSLFNTLGFLLISILVTSPNLVQSWLSYLLLVLGVIGFIFFSSLDKIERVVFSRILELIFLYQGIALLVFIAHQSYSGSLQDDYSKAIMQLPISSLGAMSLVGILISFGSLLKLLQSKELKLESKIYFSGLNIGVYLILLLISHSRTSLLATIIGVVLCLVIELYKVRSRIFFSFRWKATVFMILIGLVVVGYYIILKKDLNLNTLTIRYSIWEAHLASTFNERLLFGWGMLPEWRIFYNYESYLENQTLESINRYISEFQSFPPGHSLYIQIFSSLGLIGIIIFTVGICILFRKIIQRRMWYLIPLFTAFAFHEFTDYHFTEYPVYFPLLFFFSSLFSLTPSAGTIGIRYGNYFLAVVFSVISLVVVSQSVLVENHKRDISKVYYFNNLSYAIMKEEWYRCSEDLKWSNPELDFISEILPERNHVFLKLFYYKACFTKENDYQEKFYDYKRKCFAMANYDSRCNVNP